MRTSPRREETMFEGHSRFAEAPATMTGALTTARPWPLLRPLVHVAGLAFLAIACTETDSAPTAPPIDGALLVEQGGTPGAPITAVMRFGNNDTGTGGPQHPSHHARANLIPTTVVIQVGGTVTFDVQPPHRVAIYEPGTQPEDIRLIPGVTLLDHVGPPGPPFVPALYIDEPIGRVFIDPAPAFGPPHSVAYTFTEPGRYLVICVIRPHFAEFKMYGWVDVK